MRSEHWPLYIVAAVVVGILGFAAMPIITEWEIGKHRQERREREQAAKTYREQEWERDKARIADLMNRSVIEDAVNNRRSVLVFAHCQGAGDAQALREFAMERLSAKVSDANCEPVTTAFKLEFYDSEFAARLLRGDESLLRAAIPGELPRLIVARFNFDEPVMTDDGRFEVTGQMDLSVRHHTHVAAYRCSERGEHRTSSAAANAAIRAMLECFNMDQALDPVLRIPAP